MLVLSDQQVKTQRNSIYSDIKQKIAANINISEAGRTNLFEFLFVKMTETMNQYLHMNFPLKRLVTSVLAALLL